jgi:hypothetical protein
MVLVCDFGGQSVNCWWLAVCPGHDLVYRVNTMSDVVEVKVDWQLILLNEDQTVEKFVKSYEDFPMTLQVDSYEWDRMSSDDREEIVINDLWERCRTNIVRIKE